MKIAAWLSRAAWPLVLLAFGNAQACELTYDERWKIWRADCKLNFDPKGPIVRNEMVVDRYTLKLPDLQIDKLKFYLRGNTLEVHADILNQGTQTSLPTTVDLNVTLTGPAGNTTHAIGHVPNSVPALAPMSSQRVRVGVVAVDYSMSDVDVFVAGMVDPPTTAQPARGLVWEGVESNNSVMHLCRVYGPNPSVAVQACN